MNGKFPPHITREDKIPLASVWTLWEKVGHKLEMQSIADGLTVSPWHIQWFRSHDGMQICLNHKFILWFHS